MAQGLAELQSRLASLKSAGADLVTGLDGMGVQNDDLDVSGSSDFHALHAKQQAVSARLSKRTQAEDHSVGSEERGNAAAPEPPAPPSQPSTSSTRASPTLFRFKARSKPSTSKGSNDKPPRELKQRKIYAASRSSGRGLYPDWYKGPRGNSR